MRDAAREAGSIALGFFHKGFASWTKDDETPVTEADIAVDRFLRERLTRERPYGWLSEESEADPGRLSAERVFIIDPIDGTAAFARGRSDWVISIGLVENGVPVAGVIFNAVEDRLYSARTGGGAHMNGQVLGPLEPLQDLSALTIASESHQLSRALKHAGHSTPQVLRCLAFAYRLCLVAEGTAHASVTFRPKKDWDVAAGHIILTEAGGHLTDARGGDLLYNRADVTHASVIAAGPSHAVLQSLLENQP